MFFTVKTKYIPVNAHLFMAAINRKLVPNFRKRYAPWPQKWHD